MRNIIIGWVIATFHVFLPEAFNLIASEVEAVFEENNIKQKGDKLTCLASDKMVDMVREFHNNNPWNAFNI